MTDNFEKTFTIVAVSQDHDTCERCGKTNLKRVVVLESPDGEFVRYGTTCAAYALLGSKLKSNALSPEVKAVASAKKWLAKGYSPDIVAEGVWNHYGFPARVKDGAVYFANSRVEAN